MFDEPITLTSAAELLGISRERLSQLANGGRVRTDANGMTTAAWAVQDYAKTIHPPANAALKAARIDELEQRAAQRSDKHRKQIHRELTASARHCFDVLASDLGALPAQASRDVETRRRFEAAVDDIKTRFAQHIP